MAVGSLSYGATPLTGGESASRRGRWGRRAAGLLAVSVACVCVVSLFSSEEDGGHSRDELQELGRAELGEGTAALLRLHQMQLAGGEGADGNSTAAVAAGGAEGGDCGDPMANMKAFSCWLNAHTDPEDVAEFIRKHKALNTEVWYKKAQEDGFDMNDWLEKHGVRREDMVRHSRAEILAMVDTLLSSNGTNSTERCGLDCWLSKYPDPEDIEGPGGWYELHKNLTEDVEAWEARQPTFDFEAWFKNHSNINGFSWPDWLEKHGLRLEQMSRDVKTAILLSTILDDGNSSKAGEARCGLDCWLAKCPDPEDIEGPGGWYELHKNLTEDVDAWYARQPTFDFEAWFKNHSNINSFSWPDWLKEHGLKREEFAKEVRLALLADVVSLFRGAQRLVDHSRASAGEQLHSHPSHKQSATFRARIHKLVLSADAGVLLWWLHTQDSFNLTAWLEAQPDVDTVAWMHEVKSNSNFSTADYLVQFHGEKVSDWLDSFKPFNLTAWLDSQPSTSVEDWLQQVTAAKLGDSEAHQNITGWLRGKTEFDLHSWLKLHPSFDLDAFLAAHPSFDTQGWLKSQKMFSTTKWLAGQSKAFNTSAWLDAQPNFVVPDWLEKVRQAQEGVNGTKAFHLAEWLKEQPDFKASDWLEKVREAQEGMNGTKALHLGEWLEKQPDFKASDWLEKVREAQEGVNGTKAFHLAQWLEKQPDFKASTWLEMVREAQEGVNGTKAFHLAQWLDEHPWPSTSAWMDAVKKEEESKNKTEGVSAWLKAQPDFRSSGWLEGNKEDPFNVTAFMDAHTQVSTSQWLAAVKAAKEGVNGTGAFHLKDWLRKQPYVPVSEWMAEVKESLHALNKSDPFSVAKWLKGHQIPAVSEWLSAIKESEEAQNKTDPFDLPKWLMEQVYPSTSEWLSAVGEEASKNHTIPPFHLQEWVKAQPWESTVQWMDTIKSFQNSKNYTGRDPPNLATWVASFPDFDSEAWLANQSQPSLRGWDAGHPAFPLEEWLKNQSDFNAERWMHGVWAAANKTGGSEWRKIESDRSGIPVTPPGMCCCGFSCEKASNECCGFTYSKFQGGKGATLAQVVKSTLSGARKQSLLQLAAAEPVPQPPGVPAAQQPPTVPQPPAAPLPPAPPHDPGTWKCEAQCGTAPVRVGATCEIECLSEDGINCLRPENCGAAAANASNLSHLQPVRCGEEMKATWGTNGYDTPTHWCACAKAALQQAMSACAGTGEGGEDESGAAGPAVGTVFASRMKFAPHVTFGSGNSFGDNEHFGAGDRFGAHNTFGDANKFADKSEFGSHAAFGSRNEFGDKTFFGKFARFNASNSFGADAVFGKRSEWGDANVIGEKATIGHGALFSGTGNTIGDKSVVGDFAKLGIDTSVGKEARLGKGVSLGQGSTVGEGSEFGVGGLREVEHSHAHHHLAHSRLDANVTSMYRPDPGSAFARPGDPRINTTYDGHSHWPEWFNDEGEGEDGGADDVSTEAADPVGGGGG